MVADALLLPHIENIDPPARHLKQKVEREFVVSPSHLCWWPVAVAADLNN
jgi:hypothetical protein